MKKVIYILFMGLFAVPALSAQDFKRVTDTPVGSEIRMTQGISMVDYNGDGFLDIYIGNGIDQQDFLFIGDGQGGFEAQPNNPVVDARTRSNAPAWADYNNDGNLDLYVANAVYQSNGFFENTGDGFEQVFGILPTQDESSSLGASWADYNNDGHVDLFVANGYWDLRNVLYRNNGDGSFTVVSEDVIGKDAYYSWQGSWVDIEDDGDLDLVVANRAVENSVFINNGDGTFKKRSEGVLANDTGRSNGLSWGDFDNDRDPDLYVTNGDGANFFYENEGDGSFRKIEDSPVVSEMPNTAGSCWADFNNDGYLDLYVVAGQDGDPSRNYLFMNQGDGQFKEVTSSLVLERDRPANGASVSCGDYNNDGFVDMLVGNWEDYANNLYVNEGNDNNWLAVKLEGTSSNRSAMGATVRVLSNIGEKKMWQSRTVRTSGGHRSQNSLKLEFGLAHAGKVDSLVIEWSSGVRQVKTDINANQFLQIKEDSLISDLTVSMGKAAGVPGDTAVVPVNVSVPRDSTISSLEFSFTFNPNLQFAGIDTSRSLLRGKDWITSYHREDRTLNLSAAGAEDIAEEGKLFGLKIVVPDNPEQTYDLLWEKALFNTSTRPAKVRHGKIVIPSYGDVDLNQKVQAFDASIILQYLLENRELSDAQKYYADVSLDEGVTALDASLILQYTTGAVDSLPVDNSSESFAASGQVSMSNIEAGENETVNVPIELAEGENIYSFQGTLAFDDSKLKFKGLGEPNTDGVNTLAVQQGGKLLFVAATPEPLNGDGKVLDAKFEVLDHGEDQDPVVELESLRWNENKPEYNLASSQITTGIDNRGGQKPKKIKLKQNYPNPFNPSTIIEYNLPSSQQVRLEVYTVSGQLVTTLINSVKSAGSHQLTFDGSGLSSGVYVYRLITPGKEITRKMMLLK